MTGEERFDPRWLDLTLEELDGEDWGEPPIEASHFEERSHYLRGVPLREFTVEDIRLMINAEAGLRFLVPLALEHLERDPFASGDFGPGDLLTFVTNIPGDFWGRHPTLGDRVRPVILAALDRIEKIPARPPTVEELLEDGLDGYDRAHLEPILRAALLKFQPR